MVLGKTWCIGQQKNAFYLSFIAPAEQYCWSFIPFPCSSVKCSSHFLLTYSYTCARYRFDMSIEEAAELGRRAIYHATFRDGASGGVASGTPPSRVSPHICLLVHVCVHACFHELICGFNLCFAYSLLCGSKWMDETIWRWCLRAPLQILSSCVSWNFRAGPDGWSIK
jgi:hypothetical protein